MMFEAIDKVLSTYLLAGTDTPVSERIKENNAHDNYRNARCAVFVGGENEKQQLNDFMSTGNCEC